MRPYYRRMTILVVPVLVAGLPSAVLAVPYASAVRNTSGSTWEFVLNEAANNVTVTRDGGNALDLGALAAGRHTFGMTGFSTFEIAVSKNVAAGWTEISQASNPFTNFERPVGLAVNRDPSSPYFGIVYVNNGRDLPTTSGRTMGDGVYALTSNLQGVDLANNFAVVTNANDASQAKAPGWTVADDSNSAFRMSLDDAGNLIVGDWSDPNGGIKYASPNLTMGGLVLAHEGDLGDGATNHGSIVSKPYVTGSVGNNLVVYAMDEDLPNDGADGNNVWRWDVGSATNYDQPPALVIDPGNLVAGEGLSPNAPAGSTTDSDGDPWFLNLNVGVLADIHRSERHGKWYLSSPRDNGHDSSALVVVEMAVPGDYSGNGAVDAADYVTWRKAGPTDTLPNDPTPGTVDQSDYDFWRANFGNIEGTPTVAWSSKQFSIDNMLDGFTDNVDAFPGLSEGINDIFRNSFPVDLSNDGTKLYVMLNNLSSEATTPGNVNPYIGPDSPNLPGHVLVIPLDANGIPDIEVDDNGTPEDPTDDFLANVESIVVGAPNGVSPRPNLDVDAAGNIYVTHNFSQLLQVFSPGGNTVGTTTSAGTFSLQTAGGGTAVPEPGTLLLAACGMLAALASARRKRK